MTTRTNSLTNVALILVIALHDPDVGVQEDAMATLLRLSPKIRRQMLRALKDTTCPSLANVGRNVVKRTLKKAA